ncbi:MAG: ThiF family adenylyltransferase [Hyphomonadaceae bacterium]|nr:ThiF family adenylyltransferase [Hyphomonadaceae bacterium]
MAQTPDHLERHKRHILLKEIGGPGVQKLAAARVSIIGAGALGGPCALYLSAAGVGQIEIWDDDAVDRSNLQRQVQFSDADIGAAKADLLAVRCKALNPEIAVQVRRARFTPDQTVSGDILIDATDNYETRFDLNRLAHGSGRYLVSGAASRWTGQVSVYASGKQAGAPCYQCFVPETPPDAEACDEVGVVGALTGMVGTRMALETIKLISDAGAPLIGRLLIIDGLSGESRILKLRPNPDCSVCGG